MKQSFLDRIYKDKEDKVVIIQFPNLPLITWLITTVAGKFIHNVGISDFLSVVAFGALFTWAWLELFQGVTYARRILGLVVFIYLLHSHL